MSQFGFFNAPQPQPQPAARPAYDAYPASHPAFDVAPRRYEDPYARAPSPRRDDRASFFAAPVSAGRAPSPRRDDRASFFGASVSSARAHSPHRYFAPASSARAPSPPRVSFFGSAVSAPRAPSPPRRAFFDPLPSAVRAPSPPPRGAYYESPAGAVVYAPPGPLDARAAYLPAHDPVMPAAAAAFFQPINGPMARTPAVYETRDAYPREASWRRSSPPREERREFFGSTDTWRSAPRRSPPRDRFNSEAFGRGRDYSPERRKSFRDDRSPARRDDRSRYDDRSKKDYKERRSYDDRDRKRERERSEDRKRDDRKDKSDKDRKSRDRDSREKERSKENGEKKRRVDDKKDERVEETDKSEDKTESKPEETCDETENNDEEIKEVEVIEEDEFEEEEKEASNGAEEKEKEKSNGAEEHKKEEKSDYKKPEETKKSDNKKVEEKLDWKSDRTENRQSRIRSPSIEKKSRSSSIEKDKGKKEYSEFKVLTDASFDEIHRPFERPYGNFNKSRNFPTSSTKKPHSGDDSWYQQYKAKVMMTKTAAYGLSGPPSAPLPAPVVPVAVAAPPPAYVDPFAAAREVLARLPPREPAYPPAVAAPRLEYPLEYARVATYGAPPAHIDRHEADPHRVHEWTRDERDAYERRRADELRSISPHARREDYERRYERREEYERRDDRREEYERRDERREEYERRDDRRDDRRDEYDRRERRDEGHHVEYFTERYRSERPDERARYADHGADRRPPADERSRYREHSPAYEHSTAQPREERESRRPPSRHRAPSPTMTERLAERLGMEKPGRGGGMEEKRPPPVEEIDASKLVEPLEDDGWDAIARLLSPEKVVVEKKTKKPLIASVPSAAILPSSQRPIPRDPLPVSGFFSQPVPSVRPKIAFADSKPFYNKEEHPHTGRPSFFPAPTDGRVPVAPRAEADAYGRATSYEELASSNGAAAYRSGPAPGWENGRRH